MEPGGQRGGGQREGESTDLHNQCLSPVTCENRFPSATQFAPFTKAGIAGQGRRLTTGLVFIALHAQT
eukprot:2436314-Rhodomonas_salina.1